MGGKQALLDAGSLRLAVAALVPVLTLAACTDGDPTDSSVVGSADAVTAIVEWQAAEQEPVLVEDGSPQLPVIFIVAGDGATFDVGVQAEVTEATVDTATIRFADDVDDTFDPGLDGEPVRDDGVMLLVGPIPEAARTIIVDVERYHTIDDWEPLQLEITADGAPVGTDDGAATATVTAVTPR